MNKTKKIVDLLDELQWLFHLNNFDRQIVLVKEDENNKGVQITFEEEYQRITLDIYPCFFKETPEEQRKMILHELCHTITIPLKVMAYDLADGVLVTKQQLEEGSERSTSKIENILNGLLQDRLVYAKQGYKNYLSKPKQRIKKGNQ
jgi:hypothetical protein